MQAAAVLLCIKFIGYGAGTSLPVFTKIDFDSGRGRDGSKTNLISIHRKFDVLFIKYNAGFVASVCKRLKLKI